MTEKQELEALCQSATALPELMAEVRRLREAIVGVSDLIARAYDGDDEKIKFASEEIVEAQEALRRALTQGEVHR